MKMNSQEFRQEIAAVLQNEGGAAAMLEQYFPGESEAILAGITRGMDAFTKQYATEIDKEAIVRDLDAHLEGKDIVAQMDYLLTMMTGLSAAASRGHGMNIWGDEIDVLQHCLDAVKEGIFDDQHPHIAQTLTEAKQLLVEHVMNAAMFCTALPEEKIAEFVDVDASNEFAAVIEGQAAMTGVAACIYAMAKQGKLEGINPETYEPEIAGVQACMHMKVANAINSGMTKEQILAIVEKVYRTAVTVFMFALIGASWFIVAANVAMIIDYIAILLNPIVPLAIMGVIMVAGMLVSIPGINHATEIICTEGIILAVKTVKLMIKAYRLASDWVVNVVVPKVKPLLIQARDFAVNKIIVPVCGALKLAGEKMTEKAEKLMTKLKSFEEQIYSWVEDAKTKINHTTHASEEPVKMPVEFPQKVQPEKAETEASAPMSTPPAGFVPVPDKKVPDLWTGETNPNQLWT